jgi:hypothetical protein
MTLGLIPGSLSAQARPPDVIFLLDTTGDMGGAISNLKVAFTGTIAPALNASHPGIAYGVAFFRDFPVAPYGLPNPPDYPYSLAQVVTTNTTAVNVAINSATALPLGSGGDVDESGHEALYQVAAGDGVTWTGGSLPPSDIGFRTGSPRVVVVITSARPHETYTGFTTHSSTEALMALAGAGVKVAGISVVIPQFVPPPTDPNPARPGLEAYARATGARVPATLLSMSGQCPTLIGGLSGRPPDADGTCPLVFDVAENGSGLGTAAVTAINALLGDLVFQDGFNTGS